MNPVPSVSDWIAYVFDHSVTEPAWYWSLDRPGWEDHLEHDAGLIAEAFEHSGELLAGFSEAQLNHGLNFVTFAGSSEFLRALFNDVVPSSLTLRVVDSFVPLFEQVMAVRCAPRLSHLDESGVNPLNGICYMWWDMLCLVSQPDDPDRAEIDTRALAVMRRQLAIPHDACRESALHGLGHWHIDYPHISEIIEEFLQRTPGLRPELIDYARRAQVGYVQ